MLVRLFRSDREELTPSAMIRMEIRTVTPIRVAHELSINLFFSVWNEDSHGRPLSREGPGDLRKAVMTYSVTLSSVSRRTSTRTDLCRIC